MIKSNKLFCCVLLLLLADSVSAAEENLSTAAGQYYHAQNWSAAIETYQRLLNESTDMPQPTKEQAWYRMANAHIQLKQGEAALKFNEKLSAATQIPRFLILYQKAQGHVLSGNESEIWQPLEQMTAAGFSNVNELTSNSIWSSVADHDRFKQVVKQADQNRRPCMYIDDYQQFDFWLGHWEVYGNIEKTGPLFGHNTITKTEQGCLLMEQWQGASGSTGTSMNYYDGILGQWVQRWVSGGGTVIDYSGGLIKSTDGKHAMQLVGKIYYASKLQQPQIRDFRGTWTPLEKGVVQQFFEESTDGGKTWNTWFNGFYFPVLEDQKNEK